MFENFDAALFLMGAAFMLLETRGVTSLSLLFGSTWIVNSSVIAGILIVALIANIMVQQGVTISIPKSFTCLFSALFLLWIVDLSLLNRLDLISRWVAGSLINALPIGFGGLMILGLL